MISGAVSHPKGLRKPSITMGRVMPAIFNTNADNNAHSGGDLRSL